MLAWRHNGGQTHSQTSLSISRRKPVQDTSSQRSSPYTGRQPWAPSKSDHNVCSYYPGPLGGAECRRRSGSEIPKNLVLTWFPRKLFNMAITMYDLRQTQRWGKLRGQLRPERNELSDERDFASTTPKAHTTNTAVDGRDRQRNDARVCIGPARRDPVLHAEAPNENPNGFATAAFVPR